QGKRETLMKSNPGDILAPIRSAQGIEMVVVCGHEADETALPTRDAVEFNRFSPQLSMTARPHLRAPRRDAGMRISKLGGETGAGHSSHDESDADTAPAAACAHHGRTCGNWARNLPEDMGGASHTGAAAFLRHRRSRSLSQPRLIPRPRHSGRNRRRSGGGGGTFRPRPARPAART